jgi:hypothetical protein
MIDPKAYESILQEMNQQPFVKILGMESPLSPYLRIGNAMLYSPCDGMHLRPVESLNTPVLEVSHLVCGK